MNENDDAPAETSRAGALCPVRNGACWREYCAWWNRYDPPDGGCWIVALASSFIGEFDELKRNFERLKAGREKEKP